MQFNINTISQNKYFSVRKKNVCIDEVSTSFYETMNIVEDNKCCVLKCTLFYGSWTQLIQY